VVVSGVCFEDVAFACVASQHAAWRLCLLFIVYPVWGRAATLLLLLLHATGALRASAPITTLHHDGGNLCPLL
jgi:hypothetical protein